MALMIRFATTIKVGNPRLTRRCVRSSVEFYTSEIASANHFCRLAFVLQPLRFLQLLDTPTVEGFRSSATSAVPSSR